LKFLVGKSNRQRHESRMRRLGARRRYSRPGERERLADVMRERWEDDAYRRERTDAAVAQWSSAEKRQAASEMVRELHRRDPSLVARMRAGWDAKTHAELLEAMWADPEWRAMMVEARHSPDYRQAQSAAALRRPVR
jgi:hypothetical protein